MRIYFRYKEREYHSGEEFNEVANKMLHDHFELMKYKIMWSLRSLEKQIEIWQGVIIFDDHGNIEFNGFPEPLCDKMRELIKSEIKE